MNASKSQPNQSKEWIKHKNQLINEIWKLHNKWNKRVKLISEQNKEIITVFRPYKCKLVIY